MHDNYAEITSHTETDSNSIPGNASTTEDDDDTVTVTPGAIFDPPFAIKTFNAAGLPEIEFRMVWVNNGNAAVIGVQVTDVIPVGTTYVANSIACAPQGGSATAGAATAPLNTNALQVLPVTACGFDSVNNRIQWQGTIAPDPLVPTNAPNAEALANNEVVISFRVTVNGGVNLVSNVANSLTDTNNDQAFTDQVNDPSAIASSNITVWTREAAGAPVDDPVQLPKELPQTGFAPNRITLLPEQPAEKAYRATQVWLEISRLGVMIPIVGVPLADEDWDVSWLWREAGWLEGTAFPSWSGNSVLTGHVTLPNGVDGPFANIGELEWGDRIIVHAYGVAFEYEVRQSRTVGPSNTSVLRHEDEPWLTLITCKTYIESIGEYRSRIAVRAVLVGAEESDSTVGGGNKR